MAKMQNSLSLSHVFRYSIEVLEAVCLPAQVDHEHELSVSGVLPYSYSELPMDNSGEENAGLKNFLINPARLLLLFFVNTS